MLVQRGRQYWPSTSTITDTFFHALMTLLTLAIFFQTCLRRIAGPAPDGLTGAWPEWLFNGTTNSELGPHGGNESQVLPSPTPVDVYRFLLLANYVPQSCKLADSHIIFPNRANALLTYMCGPSFVRADHTHRRPFFLFDTAVHNQSIHWCT